VSIQVPELDGALDLRCDEHVYDMAQDIFLIRDLMGQVVIVQIIREVQSLLMAQADRDIQPEAGLRVEGMVLQIKALVLQLLNEDPHIGTVARAGNITLTDRVSAAFKCNGFFISVRQHQTVTRDRCDQKCVQSELTFEVFQYFELSDGAGFVHRIILSA